MESIIKVIIENWIMSLIAGLAGIFLARVATLGTLMILGFYVGSYMLLPIAVENFENLKDIFKEAKNAQMAYWIFGVGGALGMVIVYKIALFLVGFFATGAIAYLGYSYLDQMIAISKYIKFLDPDTFKLVVAAVLGAFGGFYLYFREKVISTWLAIILGSGVVSISLIHIFNIYGRNMSFQDSYNFLTSKEGLYLIAGVFVVLIIIGYFANRRRVVSG